MRLITRVTSLDTSSMLLHRFPRSGFFNYGNKSKAGGLMSGLYGGWGSTCNPNFSKISVTTPEAWGRALMYDRWSLRETWLQSVSSSMSRLRFAEHGTRSLSIRTQCSVLKSGSKLSRKSERLHHPTGRAPQCVELWKWSNRIEWCIVLDSLTISPSVRKFTQYTEMQKFYLCAIV